MSSVFVKLKITETATGIVEVACVPHKIYPSFKERLKEAGYHSDHVNEQAFIKLLQDRNGYGVGCYTSFSEISRLAVSRRAQAIQSQAAFNNRINWTFHTIPYWIQS